jgi:hypothetical protein
VGSAIVVFGVAWAWTANAQVFRCTDADGHTVFSDTQCGTNSQKVEARGGGNQSAGAPASSFPSPPPPRSSY